MQTIDRAELTKAGDALKTAERLAAMAGEPAPLFVPWGKVFATSEGKFRIVCELEKRRGRRDPMRSFVERVA